MNRFFQGGSKGNAAIEVLTVIIVLTIFAIAGIFGYQVVDEMNTDIQDDSEASADTKAISGSIYERYPGLLDGMFLFVFIGFTLFVLASAFFIDTHPIFFIVAVVLLISALVVAIFVGNSYNEIMSDSTISTYANEFTFMHWIMTHILEISIAIGFFTIIILFAKLRGGG